MEDLLNRMEEDVSARDEIATLLETGFEYVMAKDSLAYFRKRK
jgi:hypothetical protein